MNGILLAIKSLSREAAHSLCVLGQMLLASSAYDNVEVNLKTSMPVSENPFESLKHLTLGLLLPLEHGLLEMTYTAQLSCGQSLHSILIMKIHHLTIKLTRISWRYILNHQALL